MSAKATIFFSLIAFLLSGCVTTKYNWGNYENTLYSYYKNPAEAEEFAENLSKIIVDGEAKGNVPPGIYAEYGYILFISGKAQEAIKYFEREKENWPESKILMDKMINLAKVGNVEKSKQKTEKTFNGGNDK